jgi:hypothetical protein
MLVALAAQGHEKAGGEKAPGAEDFANLSRSRPQVDCGMTPRYLDGFAA